MIEKLFVYIAEGLESRWSHELDTIHQQYPYERPVIKPFRLTYAGERAVEVSLEQHNAEGYGTSHSGISCITAVFVLTAGTLFAQHNAKNSHQYTLSSSWCGECTAVVTRMLAKYTCAGHHSACLRSIHVLFITQHACKLHMC